MVRGFSPLPADLKLPLLRAIFGVWSLTEEGRYSKQEEERAHHAQQVAYR
jgi:hypothetical protein